MKGIRVWRLAAMALPSGWRRSTSPSTFYQRTIRIIWTNPGNKLWIIKKTITSAYSRRRATLLTPKKSGYTTPQHSYWCSSYQYFFLSLSLICVVDLDPNCRNWIWYRSMFCNFFVDPNPHYKKLGQKAGMKDKKLNAWVIFCFVFERKLEKRIVHIFSKLIMFLCEKAWIRIQI